MNADTLKDAAQQIKEAADRLMRIWGLKWTFKSLDYILNTERVSLVQCAQAYFLDSDITGESAEKDVTRSVKILLMAGEMGFSGLSDIKELESQAYEKMEEWREVFGDLNALLLLIVERLREDHFFSEDLPVGLSWVSKIMNEH